MMFKRWDNTAYSGTHTDTINKKKQQDVITVILGQGGMFTVR